MGFELIGPALDCDSRLDEAACVAGTSNTTCLWNTASNGGNSMCDYDRAGPLLHSDKMYR